MDVAGEMSLRWRLMLRPGSLARISAMRNRQSWEKDSPMKLLQNGGDVGAGNDERRGTTAGHGGRAAPRGQAQGQAVAAGTSSRLSFLMLCGRVSCHVRAAGRDCEAYLLLFL